MGGRGQSGTVLWWGVVSLSRPRLGRRGVIAVEGGW